jgi:hypothetical protein
LSKEIAQTVGGKRIAWLLAILAAFAVMATLTAQWRTSEATPTAASYGLSGPFTDNTCTTAATAVLSGATVYYCIEKDASDATFANPLAITVGDATGITFTGVYNSNSGPTPASCATAGGGSSITCTYNGLLAGSTFETALQAIVTADVDAAGGANDVDATIDDVDLGSVALAAAAGENVTTALSVLDVETAFDKAQAGGPVAQAGGNVTYTLTWTGEAGFTILGGDLDITDTINPLASATGETVVSITPSANLSCNAQGAALNLATPFALSCTNTANLVDAASVNVVIVVSIPANGTAGPTAVPARDVCNSATATVTLGTDSESDTDSPACLSQNGSAAVNDDTEDLVHVDPFGDVTTIRDAENNVIGYRHTVCALNLTVDALWPNVLAGGGANFKITTISGSASIEAPLIDSSTDCDGDGVSDDSSISWYSNGAGEQNIIVVDDAGSTILDANAYWPGEGAVPTFNTPLVKEWNTLDPTLITLSPATITQGNPDTVSGTNLDGTTQTAGFGFNAGQGVYQGTSSTYYENVIGTHTNAAGTQKYLATGARVKFTATGACGYVQLTDSTTYVNPSGSTTIGVGQSVTVTSVGVAIPFKFLANNSNPTYDCTSANGSSTGVDIQVSYPTELGSDSPPAPAKETIKVNWVTVQPVKQVFLAWVGQRVIIEHDWRLVPGDDAVDGDPLGECMWSRTSSTAITYVKTGGPGGFINSLGVISFEPDRVVVSITDDSQVDDLGITGGRPQHACISRALFESEDPGQVDIEIFQGSQNGGGDGSSATKVAVVVYYMKLNTVQLSLVTQVSKPSHNGLGTSRSLADWGPAPGNPWDASKDDADNAAEWNVSKDLLVRGRVTGWFVNSNPSGRARDDSNPLNVLPADRWVMPNDWALLAGGPADPADGSDAIGTAEQFRPWYDILFAPNNKANIALTTPSGVGGALTNITTLAAAVGSTNTDGSAVAAGGTLNSTITVANASSIAVNACILIDSEFMKVTGKVGNTLTVERKQTPALNCANTTTSIAAHAAGAAVSVVNLAGVPFEGPYSLIDIPGLAGAGFGGAAASNLAAGTSHIRDTAYPDGDVDMWDAPMPPAVVSVAIRGTGFLREVFKDEVYYLGTPNGAQTYPNPFYISNIPDSPFISASAVGGGYLWNSWGNDGPQAAAGNWASSGTGANGDGPYRFWKAAIIGANSAGIGDSLTATDQSELALIRGYHNDPSIARDLVVYSDNHGEFMVAANGDFKTDLTACQTNTLSLGKHCAPGDKVGTGTITATVDYPDFRKHFPVLSNAATVDWTWGGYKDVTVVDGETDQFKYIVFHGMDRDGFCSAGSTGAVLLHSVLNKYPSTYTGFRDGSTDFSSLGARYNSDPNENVDFLIDSGEGIIIDSSDGAGVPTPINDGRQFAYGIKTFSLALNDPAVTGIQEFDLSPLAAEGQTDECQAWIKVSNSLLGIINVLAIAHDDEGNIGFDRVIDLTNTHSYTLTFRWSLITWVGADAISVNDAITGTGDSGQNPGGNDISASVTAIYGWDAAAQQWLGFFPSGVNVPGANDLTALSTGDAYWVAITGPSSVTWTVASNVN